MRHSIDLFNEMMSKAEGIKPEPVIVDNAPDAKGMKPELFDGLVDSLQEVVDIESGNVNASDYDVVYIQAEDNEDATKK